jgi:hypothetical protein
LSEVIHGDASEDVALRKFAPCRQLVLSVLRNVIADREIARAIDALGWDVGSLAAIAGGEVTA